MPYRVANVPGMSWICWIPPPRLVIKANFDATIWDDGRATIGYVLRDDTCSLLLVAGFQGFYNAVNESELRDAWEAIKLTREHFPGCPLWQEGDTLSVI